MNLKTQTIRKITLVQVKAKSPFTSIDSDQTMEQKNKNLKVNRGIVGLTHKLLALNRFCLAASLLNTLSDEYCDRYRACLELEKYVR